MMEFAPSIWASRSTEELLSNALSISVCWLSFNSALTVQEGAGGGDLAQHAAILLTEPGQALLSVQFEHLQIAGGHVAGQTVPHRVRRVGGNQQQRTLRRLCGKAQRGGRGADGLAHSPLAAKQQKLEALLVEKQWHMPVHFAASLHLVRLTPGIVGEIGRAHV